MTSNSLGKISLCFFVIFLAAIAAISVYSRSNQEDLDRQCAAAGGIAYHPKGTDFMCFSKSAVIKIK